MKFLLILLFPFALMAQVSGPYNASAAHPYGKLNPEAPAETADYAPMIGTCDCTSSTRNPDRSWSEPQKMTWTFKYTMNGTAVRDDSVKEDGSHSGSIRQFVADSSKWYVHWYSNTSPATTLPTWEGSKRGDSIVLYRDQKAPNGMDGFFRLTFKNISDDGFNWIGEWVDPTESFVFPTWKINCVKRRAGAVISDETRIRKKVAGFSRAYMNKDAAGIANFYTEDAKIFPGGSDIISGKSAIQDRWEFAEGVTDVYHKVTPSEIKIIDNYAYDYGYYEGSTTKKDGKKNDFRGKYVIVWQKVDGDWKIYLDIWNRL